MIELKEGTRVFTPGGEEVGRVNRFVLDPASDEVTHIVIEKGWLLPEDKVVPFEMVDTAGEDKVILREELGDFDELPPFEEAHFINVTDDDPNRPGPAAAPVYPYAPAYYWYPSRMDIGFPSASLGYYPAVPTETTRNIPEGTVPLKEGTNVMSSDDEHVGDVERLFVDADSNKVTHILISQGLLFKDRKLVPAHWIKAVEENEVSLAVPSRLLERLPSYEE
jgi:uncharacterized protein YrrD